MSRSKERVCKVCGAAVADDARFCHVCGASIAGPEEENPAILEMVEQFKNRLREYPEDATAHYNLALAFIMLGRFGAAVQALEKVIQLEPSFLDAHFQLVRAYVALGNLEAARNALSNMERIAPNSSKTKHASRLLEREMAKRGEKSKGA
ncbi:MAG: hypothetical protein RUDDFDWM_000583 [Candidatus Fervidibacterota bacterium]